ncbi:MAG: AAA family ATPase [Gallionella sp.]
MEKEKAGLMRKATKIVVGLINKKSRIWYEKNGKTKLRRRVREMVESQKVGDVGISIGGITLNSINAIHDIVAKFREHFREVEGHFLERADELEQIKFAMLTREHVLLKGKTGTAKSKLGKYSFDYIKDAKTFAIQLSKFMSEEFLFGAIDIKKMKDEGKIEHRTEESIVDCQFAFIDEVFDGNDALLRSLLEVLNERTFTRHTQRLKANLHTAILTSNFVREDEATEAFLDRILFKSNVSPISQPGHRMKMYKQYVAHGDKGEHRLAKSLDKKGVTYDELRIVSEFVLSDAIEIPEPVLKVYDMILREYMKQLNTYVSDRKANKMLNIIKAAALLKGRVRADFDDVESIKFALITVNEAQQEEVFRAVYTKLMSENVKYTQACAEIEALEKVFQVLKTNSAQKLNPKSKEILELNDEAQLFEQKLVGHNYVNGSSFKDIDERFSAMRQGTDKMIREVARVLKLSNK